MKIAIYLDEVNQAIDNSMQWSVMRHIGQELAKKDEVIFIDPLKMGPKESSNKLKKQNYDILLTYNKTGTNLIEESTGQNLMSLLEVPQVSWLVEHPVTFYADYKKTNSESRSYIFPNSTHNLFAKKMGMQGQYSNLLFASSEKKITTRFKDRPFDVCIAAQWRGEADSNAFWESMTGFEKKFFEEINQLQNTKEGIDVFLAFLAVAEYYKMPQENINDFAPALKALYWHARKNERIKMVKDMVSSGLKILLVGGDGWKSVFEEKNQVTIVPPCTHDCLTDYYMNSRAVVSTNCSNGANERTFDAQSCGAISIAESSVTLENKFEDMKDIIFYDRLQLGDKVKMIQEAIKNKPKGNLIADHGYQSFINNNTWRHRVNELSEMLDKTCSSKISIGV
jgi:hypothetical protein